MLTEAVVRTLDDWENLAPRWRDLLDDSEHAQPVATPTWLLPWWRVFGAGRELCVFVLSDAQGTLVALAPFSRRLVWHRKGVPFRRLELLPSGEEEEDEISSDYVGVIVRRGAADVVARALAGALHRGLLGSWDDLVMPAMSGEDPFPSKLAGELRKAGAKVALEAAGTCPYAALPPTWDEYVAGLDGDRRYFVRRTIRDFTAWAGVNGYSFTRAVSEGDIASTKEVIRDLHQERWRGQGAFRSPLFSAFHSTVISRLAAGDGGSVDLWCLRVGDRAVAALYNIRYRRQVYFYQGGRSLDVPKNVRPGVMAHILAMQEAIHEGCREYDFLNGPSAYKRQLATSARALISLRAVNPSFRSAALDWCRAATDRLAAATLRFRARPRRSR